jgi:hypothetical protein
MSGSASQLRDAFRNRFSRLANGVSLLATHDEECLLLMSNTERLDGFGQANGSLIWHVFASETHVIAIHRSRRPRHLKIEHSGKKR